jgi:prolyl-tRNA synthetase
MRFRELNIQTERQAPSNARTPGSAWLMRANYLSHSGEPTALGKQALKRLEESATRDPSFIPRLKLPLIQAGAGEVLHRISPGSIQLLECPACHYAARRGLARFNRGASDGEPALPLEKVPTPECNTIDSLAKFLGIPTTKTAKALMFTQASDGRFVFVAVRGDRQVSEAKLRRAIGEFRPATAEEILRSGCVPGYASPIGIHDALIIVDEQIPLSRNLVAGANESGFHFKNTNVGRDYTPAETADLALAKAGDPCPQCGQALMDVEGELLQDAAGIHFEQLLAALAEAHHDDRGLKLPPGAAPFDVYLMQLAGRELDTLAKTEELEKALETAGISVLFDDRDERAGVKFNDSDLIGCPLRVTVGERNLKAGMVELKQRSEADSRTVSIENLTQEIKRMP